MNSDHVQINWSVAGGNMSALGIYIQMKAGIERLLARGINKDGSPLSIEEIAMWKESLAKLQQAIELLRPRPDE